MSDEHKQLTERLDRMVVSWAERGLAVAYVLYRYPPDDVAVFLPVIVLPESADMATWAAWVRDLLPRAGFDPPLRSPLAGPDLDALERELGTLRAAEWGAYVAVAGVDEYHRLFVPIQPDRANEFLDVTYELLDVWANGGLSHLDDSAPGVDTHSLPMVGADGTREIELP
jgi:hypothetical protein